MYKLITLLLTLLLLLVGGHGLGPGPGGVPQKFLQEQMQSRAVDTRVTFEIPEGQPKGTYVGRIPTKSGFTYRFNEAPKEFHLDPETGDIKTIIILDREILKNDRFDLVILSSQPTYPIEVRISVIDINDNSPEFPESSIAISFSENAVVGTRLLLDAATDKDIGENGISENYQIIAGNDNEKFKLIVTPNPSGDSSYLHLETTGKLDREIQEFYSLNVCAQDGGKPTPKYGYLQVNVTIQDVNDNPPIFDQSDYTVSLNESVPPGSAVLQVTATDNDLGDNARITYYLQDTKEFAIDPETGIISTNEHLKCEEQKCVKPAGRTRCLKSCAFTVLARDHGSPDQDGRTYVTINLLQDSNDHSPVIKFRYNPDRQQYSIVDENAVNGTLVAGVYVVDDDDGSNGETSVKIVSGNEANNFQLENSAVRVNGVLDREEISKYNLTFIATDKGNPPRTTTAFLVIYVNDVNDHEPVFEKSEYSAILSESAPPGTYVTAIGASDEDTGVNAQIYYAIISGNDNQWFHINQETGLITTETDLDREIQDTVELNISARDGGPNPKWAYTQLKVMILDKNDDAPKFSLSKINVSLSENEPSGTLVAMLTATDRDQGTNGSVSYSLHSDVYENYKDAFFLDTVTGKLSTKRKLDREENSLYEIQVVAKDQGIPSSQSSTATVFLTVTDVNDNAPIFYPQNYFAPISDNLKIGSSILKVTAFDLDDGDNSKIIYMLKDSSEELFSINDFTGVITLEGNIKINSKPIYRLVVTASDKGGQFSSEDAIVEIIKESYMEDLNFNSFTGYNFVILEDPDGISLKKRDVGMVDVRNREAIYSIAYGDPNKNFHINDHTGKIITNKLIDREQTVNYKLTIVARTKLGYGKTTVNINIQDLNDNRPSFPKNNDDIKLAENTAVGHEIYLAKAKDLDLGINSRILYQLTYNPDDQFRIAATTGVVYLNKPITTEPNSINHLEITATDSGSPQLSSKMTLNIIIADVNDHTPVFDHTSYETSLSESTKINDRFFALAATDADLDLNGRISYEITEGNAENKFGVFPDGFLYLRKTLDREEKDYYSLIVIAKDLGNPSRFSSVPVVIHVIDENDNAPQFTNSTFTFYVQENQPIDSFVGKLSAYDKDIGRNAELIFSLAAVENDFAIDPKNGFLRTSRIFDREELVHNNQRTSFLTLEAIVTDNGTPRLKEKVRINVHITDENDNAPEFLRTPYKIQISEGSNVGSQIFRVYTIDIDEGLNGDVFYSIVGGNEERKFEIHDTTGQIILVKHLDRETTSKYSIKIRAHDVGVPSQLDSTAIVVIEVLDENDNTPEFTQSASQISVNEITSINSELICFKAIDNDLGVNSEVTYSITAGNRKDTFHIDEISGVLYLHKSLDYEELPIYLLNITAFDNGSPKLSTTILFSIAVEDANDNPPNFPNTAIVRQLKEGIPVFTPIVTVTASDPDSGVNGNVTYSISYQEPDDSNRYFDINPITGVVRTLRLIDRESIDTFRLTVVATDRAEPPLTRLSADKLVTVIVEDINDNMPIFVSMNAAVLPNQNNSVYRQGTTIMQVFARDIDSATNGLVSYELINDTNDLFMLDQNSGILKLKKSLHSLDSTYRISVKATDEAVQSERRSSEAYITIITDDGNEISGPVFEAVSFSGSVFENEPPGTSIVTINAKYLSDPIEYYITNITSDDGVQVDRFFDIELKNGILSTAVELDRETGVDIYLVEIYAIVGTGHAKKTSKTHVQITVLDKNDSPPTFKSTKKRYTVSEELGPGQSFALIKAEDPDTIGELKYSIVKGDDGKFNMDSQSGELKVIDSLDRETKDVYKITIRCNDGQQFTDTLIIIEINDTNDNPPVFLEQAYSFDIPENTARGFRVGQIKANDADLGVNAQLTYTVISDWANDVFSLNPQTGVFTLTSKLDYEEVQHYILVVQAQDSGIPPLSSTLTVYCNVLDLNDNSPIFDPMSYSNEILENVTIGSSVVTVSATDSDSGNNGKIVCTITAGDPIGQFQISSNGTITTARNLDRETISIYNLIITATDQPTSPQQSLSSTVQVTIIIKDVNDMSPEFVTPNETFVQENILRNTMVMPIKAIDKDEGRNGYIEYLLSPNAYFVLGSVDGTLRVAGNIDRELQNNFTITVTARDRGDPPRSTNTSIVIKVLDENDNSPVFDPKRYSANIAENASIGAMVLQVSATDIDDGLNGRVRYSISHGDANRDFGIAEDTGVIRVAKNLNYERRSQYILTVKAEDCAGDINEGIVKSDTAEITISVTDINDNPPTFLDSPYLAYVMENIAPNGAYYVINVQAYDADTPPFNNLVRYFIKEGDTDIFRINASTGDVSLLRPLDREVQEKYTLSLVAMDTGSPPLTGSGILQIIVQDVNDHSPEFKRQSYQASIKENLPIGSWVLNVLASDKDIGLNGQIRYSLSGEKLDAFNVDPDKGVISTNSILDREDTELYVLSLIAQDCSATEPRRTIVNLTITVLDENDNSPVFLFNKYEVYISDQTKAKDFVFGAQATDKDAGINNKIVYSISGEHAHNFMINPSTGVIMAHKDLRKLPSNNFNLEMEARDSGNPPKSTSSVLKIYLKPNHLFPRWNPLGKTDFILPENVEQGQVIAKFKASSPKKGNIADIKYGIAGGNVGDSIQIDSNTGEIQVMDNGLDYEVSNSYQVWIEAHDSDVPPLRSVLLLTINLTDYNDNPPIMLNQLYNATV